jgi:hypothetical protein
MALVMALVMELVMALVMELALVTVLMGIPPLLHVQYLPHGRLDG